MLFCSNLYVLKITYFNNFKQGLRIVKLGQVEYPRWPLLQKKIAKTTKSTSSPEPLGIIGYKFVWNVSGILVFKIIKIKKSTAELGHSDLPSGYKSKFAQMLISQENMNVFWSDSITMVPESNGTISYLCKLTIQDGHQGRY